MTTRYPTDLPPVPSDRWGLEKTGHGGDIDEGTAWAQFSVDADDPAQAEARALAVVDRAYQDDLRGATAETVGQTGRVFAVRIDFARPR